MIAINLLGTLFKLTFSSLVLFHFSHYPVLLKRNMSSITIWYPFQLFFFNGHIRFNHIVPHGWRQAYVALLYYSLLLWRSPNAPGLQCVSSQDPSHTHTDSQLITRSSVCTQLPGLHLLLQSSCEVKICYIMQQGIDFQAWIWANFLLQRMHSDGAEFPGVTAIFLIDLLTELDIMKLKYTHKVMGYKGVFLCFS